MQHQSQQACHEEKARTDSRTSLPHASWWKLIKPSYKAEAEALRPQLQAILESFNVSFKLMSLPQPAFKAQEVLARALKILKRNVKGSSGSPIKIARARSKGG